jgi:hypothetical protein
MDILQSKVNGMLFLGVIFSIFGILLLITSLGIIIDDMESGSTMLIISIVLYLIGSKTVKRMRRYKRYVRFIPPDRMISVNTIAGHAARPIEVVRRDLQTAVSKGYYTRVIYNRDTDEIGVPRVTVVTSRPIERAEYRQPTEQARPVQQQAPEKKETEVVNCPNCSASNVKIKGTVSVCEYCGSPLK